MSNIHLHTFHEVELLTHIMLNTSNPALSSLCHEVLLNNTDLMRGAIVERLESTSKQRQEYRDAVVSIVSRVL
jgi:hypothetical protein